MKQVRVYLVVLALASIASIQVHGAVSYAFIKEYEDKVCANEPTCNLTLTPDLEPKKLTFEGRDCMCDFECTEYNDCCKDSQYFNAPGLSNDRKTYSCHPVHKVYTIEGCLASYTDEDVKAKCAKAFKPLDEDNTVIITPVTNKNKRVTYGNAYCALCNGDTDFEPWELAAGCGEPIPSRSKREAPKVRVNFGKYRSKIDEILPLVHYDALQKQFVAKYKGKDLICEFSSKLPTSLAGHVRKCVPDVVAECAANPEGAKKCREYTAVVYEKATKKAYRNRECALCNGVPADKLSGCAPEVRTGASTLFSGGTKSAGSGACANPEIAKKFC